MLLDNIIMAVINIILGGKGGIKSKEVFCPNNFVTDCSLAPSYIILRIGLFYIRHFHLRNVNIYFDSTCTLFITFSRRLNM